MDGVVRGGEGIVIDGCEGSEEGGPCRGDAVGGSETRFRGDSGEDTTVISSRDRGTVLSLEYIAEREDGAGEAVILIEGKGGE